jgi:hypothetical protein
MSFFTTCTYQVDCKACQKCSVFVNDTSTSMSRLERVRNFKFLGDPAYALILCCSHTTPKNVHSTPNWGILGHRQELFYFFFAGAFFAASGSSSGPLINPARFFASPNFSQYSYIKNDYFEHFWFFWVTWW